MHSLAEFHSMKLNARFRELAAEANALREQAARQFKDSEAAAKEVATLCEQAAKTARLLKLPHAGVGKLAPPQS